MRKMGATSSVQTSSEYVENILQNEATSESLHEESAISLVQNNTIRSRNECQHLLRTQENHSLNMAEQRIELNPDIKTNHLGITTQYLAEENARLQLANEKLASKVKCLTEVLKKNEKFTADHDPDEIYGEPLEKKLSRLQRHLARERQEKWSAIEFSERTRVDLVNCEKKLTKSNERVNELSKKLEASESHVQDLEKAARKINGSDNTTGTPYEETYRKSDLSKFKADLKKKREARQRALSAISEEMNGLREELRKEKAKRRKVERELEAYKENPPLERVISDNNSLRNEIDILTENVERLQNVSSENIRLKFEAKHLNAEMDSMNLNLGELKFEYYEEKRKHERTMKRLMELEESLEGTAHLKSEWKEEKDQIFKKYDQEKEEIAKRTNALREVISITRQMLSIRENQVQELKTQLKEIEESVRKAKIMEENGLKAEYEKQMENIKNLKELYEERVLLMESEKRKLDENLNNKNLLLKDQEREIESLRNQIESSRRETKLERQENENMNRELRLTVAKCKDLENELRLINNMFTQMLLGPFNTGNETDLDKLTELLQENHDLIVELTTREDSSEIASVLPKLLLDLITQVDGTSNRKDDDLAESCDTISEQSESLLAENQGAVLPILSYRNATLFKSSTVEVESVAEEAKEEEEEDVEEEIKMKESISPAVQEIASNLPKVWKVLMELLSHHSVPEEPIRGDEKQCYKNVDTPNGPISVISVSKTFIRLKDLIIEKKALQKELIRLKHLNSHLECRLDDQEKRLSQVQCELHKTWGIVGRMRAQHQQLHNHEKILRYELQEKRVMLTELKQELEYCREKWEKARQKNDESETEWRKLRREFAARKSKGYLPSSLNDSGESGFSDEQEDFDADRSCTQSPVDHKLLEEAEVETNFSRSPPKSNSVEELIKQSENNLKQTSENIEEIKLEECATISAALPATSKARENSQAVDDREKAKEARDLRLKRLEEQCKLLVRQVDITSHKSNYLSDRLEELHEQYGSNSGESRGQSQIPRTSVNNNQPNSSPTEEEPSTSQSDHERTNPSQDKESDDESK